MLWPTRREGVSVRSDAKPQRYSNCLTSRTAKCTFSSSPHSTRPSRIMTFPPCDQTISRGNTPPPKSWLISAEVSLVQPALALPRERLTLPRSMNWLTSVLAKESSWLQCLSIPALHNRHPRCSPILSPIRLPFTTHHLPTCLLAPFRPSQISTILTCTAH